MGFENIKEELFIKSKYKILITDYLLIILIFSFLDFLFPYLDKNYSWSFRLFLYFIYYTLPEFIYKQTLGMKLWKVIVFNPVGDSFNKRFLFYSLLALLDRYVFIVFYLMSIMLILDTKLLLSEKLSGLRWEREA